MMLEYSSSLNWMYLCKDMTLTTKDMTLTIKDMTITIKTMFQA